MNEVGNLIVMSEYLSEFEREAPTQEFEQSITY